MASSKTKRAAAVTALVVSLLAGGVAGAQADNVPCHGKGLGTGAPGNGKGQGHGTGAPGNGKGQGMGTGAPSCKAHDESDDQADDHPAAGTDDQNGPGTDDQNGPGTDDQNGGSGTTGNEQPIINVDLSVQVELPGSGVLAVAGVNVTGINALLAGMLSAF